MKKIVLLLCLVVLLTGCNIKTINDDNIDTIIEITGLSIEEIEKL